jgi:hypothetical protein
VKKTSRILLFFPHRVLPTRYRLFERDLIRECTNAGLAAADNCPKITSNNFHIYTYSARLNVAQGIRGVGIGVFMKSEGAFLYTFLPGPGVQATNNSKRGKSIGI